MLRGGRVPEEPEDIGTCHLADIAQFGSLWPLAFFAQMLQRRPRLLCFAACPFHSFSHRANSGQDNPQPQTSESSFVSGAVLY
jgi:hypothetical protein